MVDLGRGLWVDHQLVELGAQLVGLGQDGGHRGEVGRGRAGATATAVERQIRDHDQHQDAAAQQRQPAVLELARSLAQRPAAAASTTSTTAQPEPAGHAAAGTAAADRQAEGPGDRWRARRPQVEWRPSPGSCSAPPSPRRRSLQEAQKSHYHGLRTGICRTPALLANPCAVAQPAQLDPGSDMSGRTVAGRYELQEMLGKGGFGVGLLRTRRRAAPARSPSRCSAAARAWPRGPSARPAPRRSSTHPNIHTVRRGRVRRRQRLSDLRAGGG